MTIETRTGDTPAHKRQRQKVNPPDILLTTPEQLALLIATPAADRFFSGLRYVIFDELHSLVTSKRGHLLALGLARLRRLVPSLQTIGLSATVSEPDELRRWLVSQDPPGAMAELITVAGGAKPEISILEFEAARALGRPHDPLRHSRDLPGDQAPSHDAAVRQYAQPGGDAVPASSGGSTRTICRSRCITARSTSASGGASRRRWRRNSLRAIVATSTLDLGIDWGDVDLVIHVGAPKGASRLAQRIGRSNHRMDEPSRAILVPSNRFEVLECRAALEASTVGAQDTPPLLEGALDVLSQHVLGVACGAPFSADELYDEVRSAAPYAMLDRATFDRVVDFVATGGYALRTYERYARIRLDQGRQVAHRQPACRPAIPAERRHHRRAADAQRPLCAPRRRRGGARRPGARQDRGVLPGDDGAWRHLPVRRQDAALRGHSRE